MKMKGSLRLVLTFVLFSCLSTVSIGQVKTFEDLIRANSYPLAVANRKLSGSGMDFLLKATADAQFVAIGEDHNVKEIPEITALLFKALHQRFGYNYLALEQDPLICRMVSEKPLVGNRDAIFALEKRYPNGFTFNTDQELEMIADVGSMPGRQANRIWGLDQVFGALHVLERLMSFARTQDARNRTLKLIEAAREYDAVRFTAGRHYLEANVRKPDDFYKLKQIYQPKKGSEAEFLIDQLLLSARAYQNYENGTKGKLPGSFENGREREENMKDLVMLEYRRAQAAGDRLPKVLLKFGHWHLYRGMYKALVPTLGNFSSEFAKSNGMKSFQIAIFINNKPGTFRAPTADSWWKPLTDLTPTESWTIVDLRSLREYLRPDKLQVNAELKQLILGFDAALVIGGAHQATENHVRNTRYYQPELPRERRVEQLIDRTGNILWRNFGEDVFMISLHRPWQCRVGTKWGRCLPLDGAIDCAASQVGHPVGFDVARSPFAEMKIAPEALYAQGYPSLRLGDMTDGYIWTMPIEEYKAVALIPLAEFEPDQASLDYVFQHNPFSDKKGLDRSDVEKLAEEETARLANFVKSSGWESLSGWRQQCKN